MKSEQINYILRNINRKRKQSFFTILCILISSLIIFGNIALNNGIERELKKGINEAISGQITIYSTDSSNINIMESQLKEQKPFILDAMDKRYLEDISGNLLFNRRIRFGSLISYEDETSFINIHALENPHLQRLNNLISINSGNMPDQDKQIVLSETMKDNLKCNIGDTILLVADNINGYMSDETAIVSGIFEEKGLSSYFGYTAFMPYNSGKGIVQLEDDYCLELIINSLSNSEIPTKEVAEIANYISDRNENIKTASWDKTVPLFHTIVNIWKGGGYFTQIIFIVFSLVILTNLASLVINSRKKEFGTLLALGFSWKKITTMLCIEYLIICSFSVLLSFSLTITLIALTSSTGIYIQSLDMQTALMAESLFPFLDFKNLLYVLLLFCFTIIISVLISVLRLKRLKPVAMINQH